LYKRNIQSIKGLCSLPESEPSVVDYICWLSTKVTGLPEVFAGVNENFIFVTIEGAPVIAGGSIALAALQASAADSKGWISCLRSEMCEESRVWCQKNGGAPSTTILCWPPFKLGFVR
jgi:hypothetical protein